MSPGDWTASRRAGHAYRGSISVRRLSQRDRQKLRLSETRVYSVAIATYVTAAAATTALLQSVTSNNQSCIGKRLLLKMPTFGYPADSITYPSLADGELANCHFKNQVLGVYMYNSIILQ